MALLLLKLVDMMYLARIFGLRIENLLKLVRRLQYADSGDCMSVISEVIMEDRHHQTGLHLRVATTVAVARSQSMQMSAM